MGHALHMEENSNTYSALVLEKEGKDHLELANADERIMLKCDKYLIWEGLGWIHVAQNRV